jgi:hypothetical protein
MVPFVELSVKLHNTPEPHCLMLVLTGLGLISMRRYGR